MKRRRINIRSGINSENDSDELNEPTTSTRKTRSEETTKETTRRKPIPDQEQQINGGYSYSFIGAVKKTYNDFCTESTIHGFRYLHKYRKRREKIFWIILMVITLVQCAYLIRVQYVRWDTTPVILSFSEREIPVSYVPFPAITICTETKFVKNDRINFTRFFNYIRNYIDQPFLVEPPEWLTSDEYLKMRALLQVCGNYLVTGMKFPEYPPMNVIDHLNELAPSFENNFLFCQFNQTKGDCAPLFEKIYTEEGICYTFNALNETELYRKNTYQYQYFVDDKHVRKRHKNVKWSLTEGYTDKDDYDTYPERVIGSGMSAGLFVVMQGFQANMDYICRGPGQGFKVMLHSPDDVPQVDKRFMLVPYEQDVLILVQPHLSYTTDSVKHYSPDRRNCYYPEERYLRFFQSYTQNNCEIECLSNFTLRKCGCVQFSMPRLSDTKVCDAAHIHCYDQAENDFLISEYTGLGNQEEKCNCLPGCWMMDYSIEMSNGILNMENLVESYDTSEFKDKYKGAEMSRVTIYFKNNEFTAWKRSKFFGLGDFLAHCGGLFGLLMGVTAVNFIELLYYWTVRLFKNTTN